MRIKTLLLRVVAGVCAGLLCGGAAPPLLDAASVTAIRSDLPTSSNAVVVVGRWTTNASPEFQTIGGSDGASAGSDTVFEIGSITKVFTALVLADMVRHGEIALSDPIDKCLPRGIRAPTYAGRRITFLDLADHHSGLPRMPSNLGFLDSNGIADYSSDKMYAALASYKLTRAPGVLYEYSNWGVGLLGQLLANCSGSSYSDLVEKLVIEPLGLRSTTVPAPHAPMSNLITASDADGNPEPAMTWNPSLAAAGAIRSTVADLLNLGEACLPKSTGSVADDCHFAEIPRADAGSQQARVGLVLETEDKDGIVWHNGETAGYHAYLGIDAATSTVVALLNNTGAAVVDQVGFHLLNPERAIPQQPATFAVDAKALDAYAGRYQVPDGSGLLISVERTANGLRVVVPILGTYRLDATAPDAFATRERMTVTFCTRHDGSVYALTYKIFGKTDVATRVATE